jgi:16S rRNA (guanine966-N2)-methyltransferase
MRIVGGTFGGRVLKAPAGSDTRPTSEKVREALFNILARKVVLDGAVVLDLCAGSGALGLEALSRGAATAIFVEKARPALEALRGNIAALGVAAQARVIAGDAVVEAGRLDGAIDLVFVDPPYKSDVAVRAVSALRSLADTAIVVIEHDNRNVPPDEIGSLLRTDQRRYGDTSVSFYTRSLS